MTADEIRNGKLSETELFRELVAQVAELKEFLQGEQALQVTLVGPGATDLHTLAVGISSLPRRRRY